MGLCSSTATPRPGALAKDSGVPTEALRDAPPAASDCLQFEGRLLKESRKGAWQARYFRVSNGFLLYYRREGDARPACSLALRDVLQVERLDELTFRLAFVDGTTYTLRAAYQRLVESWVSAIESHVRWCKAAGGQGPLGSPTRGSSHGGRGGSTSNFAAATGAGAVAPTGAKSPGVVSPAVAASSGGTPGALSGPASSASPAGSEAWSTASHGSVIGVRSRSNGRGDSTPDSDDDAPRGSGSRARDADGDHDDWYPRSAGPRSPAAVSGAASASAAAAAAAGAGSSATAAAAGGDAVQTRGSRANSAAMAAPAVVGHAITTAAATALAGATGLFRGVTTTVTSTITGLASGTGAAHDTQHASQATGTGTRAGGGGAAGGTAARGAPTTPVLPPWLRLYARMAEEAAEEGTGDADEVSQAAAGAPARHRETHLARTCIASPALLAVNLVCRWSWLGHHTRAHGSLRTSGRRRRRRGAASTATRTSAHGGTPTAQPPARMPLRVPLS